jgi:hypothetical protein
MRFDWNRTLFPSIYQFKIANIHITFLSFHCAMAVAAIHKNLAQIIFVNNSEDERFFGIQVLRHIRTLAGSLP